MLTCCALDSGSDPRALSISKETLALSHLGVFAPSPSLEHSEESSSGGDDDDDASGSKYDDEMMNSQ